MLHAGRSQVRIPDEVTTEYENLEMCAQRLICLIASKTADLIKKCMGLKCVLVPINV
jgi:hypothetical protein